jgi:uncharacterized membrane protein
MRILGLIATTSTLLAACGERRDDPPAAAPANQSEAQANPSGASANESGAAANQSDLPASQSDTQANPSDAPAARAQAAGAEAGGKGAGQAAPSASAAAGPCRVQDGKPVAVAALRATGTEPFWGARVEGRCVIYSNPEDQKGSRVWTRFTAAPGGGTWSGSLNGKRFELRIQPKRGCSDGMSDKSYPLSADLVVGGEKRSGCAGPA